MPHSSNAARLPRLASWWKGLDTPPARASAPAVAAPSASASAALPPRSNALGGAAGDRDGAVAMMRRTANHELIDRIVAFLHTHDLDPSPDHLLIARSYAIGDDPALAEAIDTRVRTGEPVSPAFLDRLPTQALAERNHAATLADLGDTLQAAMLENSRLLGRSSDSARAYEAALGGTMQEMTADPEASLGRLVMLTTAAVDATRDLAHQLDTMERETTRLRSRLNAARRTAEQDHLTRLPNRRSFDARLARETGAEPRCVALCDIDDFKRINDIHGHEAGDRVLKVVARHLKTALGDKAVVARHGGEEFACLFPGMAIDGARPLLEGMREGLEMRSFVNSETGTSIGCITVSIGLAPLESDPRAAMRAADAALYAAKRAGKNRVIVAQPGEPDG